MVKDFCKSAYSGGMWRGSSGSSSEMTWLCNILTRTRERRHMGPHFRIYPPFQEITMRVTNQGYHTTSWLIRKVQFSTWVAPNWVLIGEIQWLMNPELNGQPSSAETRTDGIEGIVEIPDSATNFTSIRFPVPQSQWKLASTATSFHSKLGSCVQLIVSF